MLVGAVDRGVHAHRPVDPAGGVRVGEDFGVNPVPGAICAEPAVSLPGCLPGAELGWQVTPGRTGPEPPDDALDHPAVVPGRTPPLPEASGINGSIRAQAASERVRVRDAAQAFRGSPNQVRRHALVASQGCYAQPVSTVWGVRVGAEWESGPDGSQSPPAATVRLGGEDRRRAALCPGQDREGL